MAPSAVVSCSSKKPAGKVQKFVRGYLALRHKRILSSHKGMVPTTFLGF